MENSSERIFGRNHMLTFILMNVHEHIRLMCFFYSCQSLHFWHMKINIIRIFPAHKCQCGVSIFKIDCRWQWTTYQNYLYTERERERDSVHFFHFLWWAHNFVRYLLEVWKSFNYKIRTFGGNAVTGKTEQTRTSVGRKCN